MVYQIKMPKNINTLDEYQDWVNSFTNENQELEVLMKRRTNFYPYAFTTLGSESRVHYLISDSVSSGIAQIKSFNRIFIFQIRTYS